MLNPKKRKRHTPEQTIVKLRETDAMWTDGASIEQVCQQLEDSEAKRLKELKRENGRLKRLLTNAEFDKAIFREVINPNY